MWINLTSLLFTWHKSTKYCTVSVIQRARYLLTCINVTASNILGQHYSGKHYSNHSVFLRFSPSPNGSWLTKAGVVSSIELTSMTSPLAGEMRSLAAFTLSKAPKSSEDTNTTRLHSFNKSQRYIKKRSFHMQETLANFWSGSDAPKFHAGNNRTTHAHFFHMINTNSHDAIDD